MRKAMWSAAALVALLAGTGVLLGGAGVKAADATVSMVDGPGDATKVWKFEPAEITVSAGTKVIWKNTGDQSHTATADDGSFDSGLLNNGKEFSQVIDKTVTYKCTPHPWMTGKINVTGGATPTPVASTSSTTAPTAGTTSPAGGSTTTTTAKAAAGGSTTTTTAGGGATSTTQAPSVTPTSAPETGGVTTTTAAPSGTEEAAEGHGSEGPKSEDDDDSSPIGIAFAAVSTLLLLGISGKLLGSKP